MAQSSENIWAMVNELPGTARDMWHRAFQEALAEVQGDVERATAMAWKVFKKRQTGLEAKDAEPRAAKVVLAVAVRGETPEWVRLSAQAGRRSGEGLHPRLADRQVQEAVVADWEQRNGDMAIGLEDREAGGEGRLAGWVKELRSGTEGLWLRVEWTARGLAVIAGQESDYLLLTFLLDGQQRPVRLGQAALTNLAGRQHGLGQEAARPEREARAPGPDRLLSLVREQQGGDYRTERAAANQRPGGDWGQRREGPELKEFLQELAQILDLEGAGTQGAVRQAVRALKERQDRESRIIPSRSGPAREPAAPDPAATIIHRAIGTGLLTPEQKRWAEIQASHDWQGFQRFLELAAGAQRRQKKKRPRLALIRALLRAFATKGKNE